MNALNNAKTSDILDIIFEGGESRSNPQTACDYMIARVRDIELYAELPALDEDECGNYDELLAAIIDQAKENGIEYSEIMVNGNKAI